jgi:hypothetical protein
MVSTMLHSQSTVETHTFYSPTLEEEKSYLIYLPEGYNTNDFENYPSVYFLRLHESEWFNPLLRSDGTTLQDVLDDLIENGQIGKMIIVAPNTGGNTSNSALGIVNMLRPDLSNDSGIGTGKFEDYFFQDLIPHIDSTYRTIPEWCARGIDGFSLGGYASTLYGLKHPGVFSSIGSYDGTLMYYDVVNLVSPWFNPAITDWIEPMFDSPFDTAYMKENSAIHVLIESSPEAIDSIREISFHISAAVGSLNGSNLEVNEQFVDSLAAKGISNTYDIVALDPNSEHFQDWADFHATQSLVKHWETFSSFSCELISTGINNPSKTPQIGLFQSFPNPVSNMATIEFESIKSGHINLNIFDALGNKLENILNSEINPGLHQIQIDMSGFTNGVYFYQLETEPHIYTKKIMVLR